MSKSTETTNDRVPRVLVRFGKHPSIVGKHSSSVWKHHRAWGNTIERGETLVSRGAYRGVAEGDRGVAEGGPRRAGLSEREDAGRGGCHWTNRWEV